MRAAAVEAPVGRQDQPEALSHLDDVLELARREEPAWPEGIAKLRASGALLNLGEDDDDDQDPDEPDPDDDHSDDDPNPDDDGEESFTDFDLDSLPQEARGAAEAAMKRMQADYTRKTQTAAEKAREAEQYQAIVQGLEDPERAPEILRIMGWDLDDDDEFFEDDEELFDRDPRVDELEQRLAERDEAEHVSRIAEQEDEEIAEQIEAVEKKNDQQFTQEEIAFLYLYADEYRDEQGSPNVKAAVNLLEGIVASRQQQWLESKKAPRRLRTGKPASRQVDPEKETREERVERMAAAAEAARGAAE